MRIFETHHLSIHGHHNLIFPRVRCDRNHRDMSSNPPHSLQFPNLLHTGNPRL